jgi:bifunctional non-homologous end joining protein LigD
MLWDSGEWTPEDANVDAALDGGKLKFELTGTKLKGTWTLVRMPHQEKNWLLIKHLDEWAGGIDIVEFAPASVKSGEDMGGILRRDKSGIDALAQLKRGGEAGKMLSELLENAKAFPDKKAK